MKEIGSYKIIGETRDDAAGECFDKTARILGLPYPGGPAIAAEAVKLSTIHHKLQIKLPRPMINSKDYDFSFSGLKTAVLYDFKKRPEKIRRSKEYIREMAKEIQQAIIDVLIKKTIKAAKDYRVKSIILGGGVAANKELRKQFNYTLQTIHYSLNFLVPPKIFCTDNAAMIGIAGYFNTELPKEAKVRKKMKFSFDRGKASKDWKKIKVNANLRI
jgi:N6-L-threonylcarbamoyladenine synthase